MGKDLHFTSVLLAHSTNMSHLLYFLRGEKIKRFLPSGNFHSSGADDKHLEKLKGEGAKTYNTKQKQNLGLQSTECISN